MNRFRIDVFLVVAAALALPTTMVPTAARADINNPDLLPLGARASQLGNAGITTATSEAVYYNPANLTRISTATISASGSTYQAFSTTLKDALVLGDEASDLRFDGFNSIPSAVISTYRVGSVSLATSVLVPEWTIARGRQQIRLGEVGLTQSNRLEREVLAIGASAAIEANSRLSIGLSLYGVRELEDLNLIVDVTSLFENSSTIEYFQTHEQRTSFGLFGVLGLSYEASDRVHFGARIRSPNLSVAGHGNLYVREFSADGVVVVATESEVDGFRTHAPVPVNLGVGASIIASSRLEIVADVNAQVPGRAVFFDDSEAGKSAADLRLAIRASIGAEIRVFENNHVRLGLVYNPAAVESKEQDSSESSFRGVTGGFAWSSERTTTSLGGFFLDGRGQQGGKEVVERHYGALLSTSYRL